MGISTTVIKKNNITKIKANPMNLTVEIGFAVNDSEANKQKREFHYALIVFNWKSQIY
jgi:hypothetical protein